MYDQKKTGHGQVSWRLIVNEARERRIGACSVGALYTCFLRAAELPGQWHEGSPSFPTACMIFPRDPLALLPSTGPSWLVNGAAWERRKRKEKGKRDRPDGRGRPDEREFPSSNLKWEWKARNWAFNDDKNWIVRARENEIDTQFLHKVYVDIKNKIYKTNFMCIKRGLTSFLRCIL